MNFKRIALYGIVLPALAGCVTKGDMNSMRDDLEEMKSRSLKMEKDVTLVRDEVRDAIDKNLTGVRSDVDTLRKSTADVQANMDSVKVDVQVLGGKVDDLANLNKKPADELALLKEDTSRRQSGTEGRLEKLEKTLEELQKQFAEVKNREAEKTPDAVYQKGIDNFKAGDFPKAREQFTRFIELFPNHDLTANAHYWLGETYYSEKVYDQAILEFEKVIKNFPTKGKVPAALLKQGMAFKELGDSKSARFVYKKLIDNYPLADEVKPAKDKLKDLK